MTVPPGDVPAILMNCLSRLELIATELTRCFYHQQIWSEVRSAMAQRFPDANPSFINTFSQTYGNSQVMAIRRFVDHDDQTESLWQLYDKVPRNPMVLSRESYVQASADHYGEPHTWQHEAGADRADEFFTRTLGTGAYADPAIIAGYQLVMTEAAADVKAFVDQRVAHLDPAGRLIDVTFDAVHLTLDHLAADANRLQVMFTRATTSYEHAAIVGDWKAPLRASLFPRTPGPTWGPHAESITQSHRKGGQQPLFRIRRECRQSDVVLVSTIRTTGLALTLDKRVGAADHGGTMEPKSEMTVC